MATDRSLDFRGANGRGDQYKVDEENQEKPVKKVKKINQKQSRTCCSCCRKKSAKEKAIKEEPVKEQVPIRVYVTPIEELWYFARVWRALLPRYCNFCDEEILSWQEEYFCNIDHILHLECARVKWIGNKVCPLCVEEPDERPRDFVPVYGKERAVLDEEVASEEVQSIPMKPNAI